MSELTEIVRELVTATCRDGVSGFCCTECGAQIYGYGIGREKIPHQEGCFIPRIESALAAHAAEVAALVAIKDAVLALRAITSSTLTEEYEKVELAWDNIGAALKRLAATDG